ncbi:MAG: Hpt domain-containing protein, partial [Burkholderiaceae bacterium]
DMPPLLQSLRAALAQADTPTAVRAAHTLKSCAATVAARELARLAAATETHARAGDMDEVARQLPELAALVDQTTRQLCAIRDELQRAERAASPA